MAFKDIDKFQFISVNAFQGLVIDADVWRDAHKYHRDHQRLHTLIFHKVGIIDGLEVTASNPPDLSVNILPGVAVDPEGNVIIVPKRQHYRIQTKEKTVIHLIIQFREVPAEPYQPMEGGQPTRILEAYRIQEREKLPNEPHLELARIDFDPAQETIKDAKTPAKPGKNEINLGFRQEATSAIAAEKPASTTRNKELPVRDIQPITLGRSVVGGASKDLHSAGLVNLVREVNRQDNIAASVDDNVDINKDINKYTMIYLTGNSGFELTAEQQAALGAYLQSGGVIFGEGCAEAQGDTPSKGAKEFGLAFNQLAGKLKCKLEMVQRGHRLLSSVNIFSEAPPGAENGMLLEGGNMVYSGSDYGCAWQGGHQDNPLSRDIIRSSFEIGANILNYAMMMKGTGE